MYNNRLRGNGEAIHLADRRRPRRPARLVELDAEVLRGGNAYGIWRSAADARRALESIAREHRWCFTLLGLEAARDPASVTRWGVARGACMGSEPAAVHLARVKIKLMSQRLRPWPHPGPMLFREGTGERVQYHVIDGWQHLDSFDVDADAAAWSAGFWRGRVRQKPFDIDGYRILTRHSGRRASDTVAARRRGHVELSATTHRFVASSPRGFGDLLARELRELGASEGARACARRGIFRTAGRCLPRLSGVARGQPRFSGWSRISMRPATRPFTKPRVPSTGARTSIRRAPWPAISPAKHPEITHTRLRARCVSRTPSAISCARSREAGRTSQPSVPQYACMRMANGPKVTVSIDLSGEGLHRRGYRSEAGEAPLRENLAAGILVRAGLAREGRRTPVSFSIRCVRSGTLVIEAAMIAGEHRAGARAATILVSSGGWGHDAKPPGTR